MSNSAKILQQGHLDGFCLLYSVMNAYKTLTHPNKDASVFSSSCLEKWKKIINLTPSLQNFSSGIGSDFGLKTTQGDLRVTTNLIQNYFVALNEYSKEKHHVNRISIDEALSTDFTSSVLIFAINEKAKCAYHKKMDHWMCAVEKDKSNLLLACSNTWHEYEGNYSDIEKQYKSGRYYNNLLSLDQFDKSKIYDTSIHCVSMID